MRKVPLTLLNGFLGAGKTTLLKSLIVALRKQQIKLAVIVNDMSELDVDGVLIANTELVGKAQLNFVTISATTISSESGIKQLDAAIDKLLHDYQPDLILLETSGSSHPLPLLRYFREHTQVTLKGFLTLVDAMMLREDFDCGEKLLSQFQANLQAGVRGMENLLVEQIMLSSQVLLTKSDRLTVEHIQKIGRILHPLNPYIDILATQWGRLDAGHVLNLPDYNFQLVKQLMAELEDVMAVEPVTIDKPAYFDLQTRVIDERRPFHPQRLWDTYQQHLGGGIHRSKGFFWLPSRDDLALLWNQAAGSISLEFISYWKAGVLNHEDNGLSREERQQLMKQLDGQCSKFGDRHCKLTVIGQVPELDHFVAALKRCFCTDAEILHWQNGGYFDDPWPKHVVRITSE
ncbi:CobW family GTP-binding protein [Rouxiella sp. Mn2063]|uniref:CobW family GTP-binding protein n=1 Tax=Rouxiella sp. Mn2063 TaxID=3395262 RepID=UPI003BE19EB0